MRDNRQDFHGFTLIELIIYLGLFSILTVLITRISFIVLTGSAAVGKKEEVASASTQALLTIISRVQASEDIEDASSTLRLRVADAGKDPTTISAAEGTIFIREGAGSELPLTPPALFVKTLAFEKYSQGNGTPPSVHIVFAGGYNTNGILDENTLYVLTTTAALR